jgi:phosphorylated adapter RNA export protein
MYGKGRPNVSRNEDASSQGSALVDEEIEAHDDPENLVEEAPPANDKAEIRKPVADRIRVPVSYDDLFEEGEIHEEELQN